MTVSAIQQTNGMGRRTMIRHGPGAGHSYRRGAGLLPGRRRPVRQHAAGQASRWTTAYGAETPCRASPKDYGTSADVDRRGKRDLDVNKTLQIGERLTVVPGVRSTRAGTRGSPVARSKRLAANVEAVRARHQVRRGDSLWRIAEALQHHGRATFAQLNGISVQGTTLHPGTLLARAS